MPKAQRSRACTQCRERRVKCDETPDFCNQCRRLGLQCSGPIVGSVIIDMTDRVTKSRARKKKAVTKPNIVVPIHEDAALTQTPSTRKDSALTTKSEPSDSGTLLQNVPLSASSSDGDNLPPEAEQAIATIRYQYRAPQLYQPSKIQGDALDMAFLLHFVEMNQYTRNYTPEMPWLNHLPLIHSRAAKPAVKLSIRAASMAFFAKLHHDPTILVDSYRWYTVSLNAQRMSLFRLGQNRIPDDEEILVPIILGLYEVYAGTTSDSVLHHVAAACEIIKMRGPENCKSGLVWPLFKAMRVSDAQKALILNKPSVFASPDWMTIPFANMPRNAHHDLADIVLMIPDCIALCRVDGSLRTFFNSTLPPNLNLEPCRKRTRALIEDLNRWAAAYPYLAHLPSGHHIIAADMASLSMSGVKPAFEGSSTDVILPDSFVALTVATFESVQLTLTLLLHKLITQDSNLCEAESASWITLPSSPSPSILFDQAVRSANLVLKTAGHLEATKTTGFDFIRSVTPVVVVAILGPTEDLTSNAMAMLKRWGEKRGMNGLVGAWMHL